MIKNILLQFYRYFISSVKDLLPIVVVIVFFQFVVLQKDLPNVFIIAEGLLFTIIGLSLFIYGLNIALFPIGESIAYSFVENGNIFWLLIFSAMLGFGTTIAEPALIAITNKASEIASNGGIIANNKQDMHNYATSIRYTVAISVGFSVVLGVIRIIKNWPLYYIIASCYSLVIIITLFAPDFIIGIAYDIGGVTTSTITVPLITALGVGLASSIKNRNPLNDGFGMIGITVVVPIIAVLIFGILHQGGSD